MRLTAAGPGLRLWERRRRDPDYLVLRVGTIDQPSLIEVEDPAQAEGSPAAALDRCPDTPVALDLAGRGVVGLAGDPDLVDGLARWLLVQVAVLHSPRDVRIHLLTEPAAAGPLGVAALGPAPAAGTPTSGRAPLLTLGNDPGRSPAGRSSCWR